MINPNTGHIKIQMRFKLFNIKIQIILILIGKINL